MTAVELACPPRGGVVGEQAFHTSRAVDSGWVGTEEGSRPEGFPRRGPHTEVLVCLSPGGQVARQTTRIPPRGAEDVAAEAAIHGPCSTPPLFAATPPACNPRSGQRHCSAVRLIHV
jgi:hypothetical protein